jgi:hypothetical protein
VAGKAERQMEELRRATRARAHGHLPFPPLATRHPSPSTALARLRHGFSDTALSLHARRTFDGVSAHPRRPWAAHFRCSFGAPLDKWALWFRRTRNAKRVRRNHIKSALTRARKLPSCDVVLMWFRWGFGALLMLFRRTFFSRLCAASATLPDDRPRWFQPSGCEISGQGSRQWPPQSPARASPARNARCRKSARPRSGCRA